MEQEIIHSSHHRLVNDLSRFVKTLQGQSVVDKIAVVRYLTGYQAQALFRYLSRFLILTLCAIHYAQIVVACLPRVALNLLPKIWAALSSSPVTLR